MKFPFSEDFRGEPVAAPVFSLGGSTTEYFTFQVSVGKIRQRKTYLARYGQPAHWAADKTSAEYNYQEEAK